MISIIMPVYNAAKYLRETIEAVLLQSYSDYELIAVNDGSTDDSKLILDEYARRDTRIRVIDRKNAGPSSARNTGIMKAEGDHMIFMDSDDMPDKDMLKALAEEAKDNDIVICGTIRHCMGETERDDILALPDKELRSRDDIGDYLTNVIRKENNGVFFFYIWNRLISTELIRRHNICFREDIRLGEDCLFNMELIRHAKRIKILEKCLYNYYVRGRSSLVGQFYPDELDRRKIMFSAMKDLYRSYDVYDNSAADLEVYEGRSTWKELRKINYSTCKLDRKQKIDFLNGFLKDVRKDYLLSYLSSKKGIENRIKHAVIKTGNPHLLLWLISIGVNKL